MNRFIKNSNAKNFLHNHITTLIPILLILIIAISEMATAIYSPSLPLVASYFNISESQIQGTMSINLLGLALSGLFYGPFSDSYGRRTSLRLGMGVFLIGSLSSMFAPTFEFLMVSRFVQGVGAGVAVVISFAIVQDLFDEKGSALVLSYMGMAISLSPGLAPILGSYIAHHYGWHMCFGIVSFSALFIMALLYLIMPETLDRNKRSQFSAKGIILSYGRAFRNIPFMKASLLPSLMIGGLWAWMTSTPILYINYLNVPLQEYGYYGFFAVLMYILGTLLNGRLVKTFSLRTLLMAGLWMCFASSLLLLGAGFIEIQSALFLQALNAPFAIGLAFLIPNGTALAFTQVREDKGTASALLGSLEMASGACFVGLVGSIFNGNVASIAILMVVVSFVSMSLCYSVRSKVSKTQLKEDLRG